MSFETCLAAGKYAGVGHKEQRVPIVNPGGTTEDPRSPKDYAGLSVVENLVDF